jgi:NADH-quinone oxidoreductase subunit K
MKTFLTFNKNIFMMQPTFNIFLFFFNFLSIALNRRNTIVTLMCIELMLLNINTNFIVFSIYRNDLYFRIFYLFILTVAASESATGLALFILYSRTRGNINFKQTQERKGYNLLFIEK